MVFDCYEVVFGEGVVEFFHEVVMFFFVVVGEVVKIDDWNGLFFGYVFFFFFGGVYLFFRVYVYLLKVQIFFMCFKLSRG